MRPRKNREETRHRFDVYIPTISIGSVAYVPQYIYQDSKLLTPALLSTLRIEFSLRAIWAEQHAQYTWFLYPTIQEGNKNTTTLEKLKVTVII